MNEAGTNDVVKNFVYPAADSHDDNDPASVMSAEDAHSYSSTGQRNILFSFGYIFYLTNPALMIFLGFDMN